MQNSEIGNGLKNTVFRGLKALFLSLGGKSDQQPQKMEIVETDGEFWVVDQTGYGVTYTGPYKREADAKGVRTRMLKKHNEA